MKKEKNNYRIFEDIGNVDISEQDIFDYDPVVLDKLLIDHTMSAKARAEAGDHTKVVNIFWATNDYTREIPGFCYGDQILPENITGKNYRIVMPRVLKDRQAQLDRTKDKAEVFTPSWVCNAQNNLVDEAWFGRKDVFNHEVVLEDGSHSWIPTEGKIQFPEGNKQKTWKKYVADNCMEITCGEAPYLVSRYDTTTGEPIPIHRRIGLLDRKMRVINENVETEKEWYTMAEKALKHTYGYEWQGDNLLLAREALLYTYIEYFMERFNAKDADGKYIRDADGNLRVPDHGKVVNAARWISWNLWQMDGIKMVVPDSCHDTITKVQAVEQDLFAAAPPKPPKPIVTPCKGCVTGNVFEHNGVPCIIRNWNLKKPKDYQFKPGEDPKSSPWQKIEFRSLLYDRQTEDEDEDI